MQNCEMENSDSVNMGNNVAEIRLIYGYGGRELMGRIPAGDKALPGLSPSANLAGVWESIAY
jgi:hypothetical protein